MSAMATESIEMQREAARRFVDQMVPMIRLSPGWLVAQVAWQPQPQYRVWQLQGVSFGSYAYDEDPEGWFPTLIRGQYWDLSGRVTDELLRRIRFEMPMSSTVNLQGASLSLATMLDRFFQLDAEFHEDHPTMSDQDGCYGGPPAAVRFISHIDVIRFFL